MAQQPTEWDRLYDYGGMSRERVNQLKQEHRDGES